MAFSALLFLPLLLAPPAPLELPPPPAMPVHEVASSPPGERIGSRLRLDLFDPWLLGQAVAGRRFSDPGGFTLGASLRFALPVRFYGHSRIGLGLLPTASVSAHAGFRTHATFGLAVGALEEGYGYRPTPSGLVLAAEAVVPFSSAEGARRGWSISLLGLARGPAFGLSYVRLPLDAGVSHALMLSFGVNLLGV